MTDVGRYQPVWPVVAMIVATLGAPAARGQASSANFVLEPASPNSGGRTAVSPSYRLVGSLAQPAPTTSAAAPSFILQSGFWGFLGSLPVPLVLAVDRNPSDPDHCDLTWSGNAPPYEVYASADCADVLSYPVASSSRNALEGVEPPVARLVCFDVESIAAPRLVPRREERQP